MTTSPPAKRDVVRFTLADKSRTGIVLDVDLDGGSAIGVYGTRTSREMIGVTVMAPSPSASMLSLHSTTYFYAQSIRYVPFALLSRLGGKCSPGLFTELRLLLEFHARTLVRPQEPAVVDLSGSLPLRGSR